MTYLDAEETAMFVEDAARGLDTLELHDQKDGTWLYDYPRAAAVLLNHLQARGWRLIPPQGMPGPGLQVTDA